MSCDDMTAAEGWNLQLQARVDGLQKALAEVLAICDDSAITATLRIMRIRDLVEATTKKRQP